MTILVSNSKAAIPYKTSLLNDNSHMLQTFRKKMFGVFFLILLLLLVVFTPLGGILNILYLNTTQTTHFSVVGDELIMNGEINSRTYDQFVEIMKTHPEIDTLVEEIVP